MAKRSSTSSKRPPSARTSRTEDLAEKLGYVAGAVASRVQRKPAAPTRKARKARSGGTVDAPGKKHRKPAPAGPPAAVARTRNTRVSGAAPRARAAGHRPRQG